ncbi:MAG: FAD-dependent oxidoreductase [Methylococcales symbiont of Iophon sp. n. MRB-2018]|nr:MAG: FAD-dependent oxidoreductase [Methylococcales symbiont of Iophon sp. n. MRB-2018]KAF3979812.1 MAG: FAD-dependent oxidoreductase [Methylococcales symbiont of Iophon sp. n. MRB-2018]
MKSSKIIIFLLISTTITAFFVFDIHHYLSLEILKEQQLNIESYRSDNPVLAIVYYLLIYIAVTALSLPGATILTLAGGGVFGLLWGTVIVSFASTLGATLAFLAARFLLRDSINSHFSSRMKAIDAGIDKDGAFYLFTLRLVPIFPFFMINLTMGLTTLKLWRFYWVSQLGMLAGTVVYVNAGTQLAKINSLSDILSPALLGSFVLLGFFPLFAKRLIETIKKVKIYSHWHKPKQFDNNLIVIGAGAAGLVTSYIASAVKAKVTLIEKHKMGGDCLNTGCVPSKALICTAKHLSHIKRAKEFGIKHASADFDFAEAMERVQAIIKTIEPHDSIERYSKLGVDIVEGEAKIISPWEVQITTATGIKTLSTRCIVIATGAHPFIPTIAGIDQVAPLTSDNIWNLTKLPKRLLVLGGGPIGCELAQCFARLGSQVTLLQRNSRLMVREDKEASEAVQTAFEEEGIDIKVNHSAKEFIIENGEKILLAEAQGQLVKVPFDQILIAVGRTANVNGYGAEQIGIKLSANKTIEINGFQQTNFPNIYACGDVSGPFQFTHTAAHQAWYAAVNALFGQFKKFRTDYSVIPWATFTDPEVARVGLNEQEAKKQNIAYEVVNYEINDLDRAIADSEAHGFVKVLTQPGKDKILGVTIVGERAGDLIAEFVLAMKHGLGLNKILATIHIYPTMAEANKYVAGNWKRKHSPKQLLKCLGHYHTWRRRG